MMLKPSAILFLCLALGLLVYMLINERRVGGRGPLWLRCFAACVAVAALVGLNIPFTYQRTVQMEPGQLVRILTRGTDLKAVDSLLKLSDCYTTDVVLAEKAGIPFIDDWSTWIAAHRQAQLAIFGFGLNPEQLNAVDRNSGDYKGGVSPSGLLFAHWDQQINSGNDWSIHGKYRHADDRAVTLYLKSAAQTVDSVLLPPAKESTFDLSYQLKQEGKTILDIIAIAGGDTLQQEKVPVIVTPPPTFSLLLLAASPSFEYKFLYNWLRDNQYQVSYRARMSKDKFLYSGTSDFFTRNGKIHSENLKTTDLLVIDEVEWMQLGVHEQREMLLASAKGMGIILVGGEDSPQTTVGNFFKWKRLEKDGDQRVGVRYRDEPVKVDLLTSNLVGLQEDEDVLPLFYADESLVAGTQLHKAGHITALTLKDTYTWWLQGGERDYTKFWSRLLSVTLPEKQETVNYIQWPLVPTAYHWTRLVLKDVEGQAAVTHWAIPTISDPWIPTTKGISFWSEIPGWNDISIGDDTVGVYSYGETDWRSMRDHEWIKMNKNYFSSPKPDQTRATSVEEVEGLPKWVFYLLFLASVGTLWYLSRDYPGL